MGRQSVAVGSRAEAAELRHELLGRLGLGTNASDQDIESAHTGLVEFLELAPHGVRSWAAVRTTDVDEAFALLSGPEEDLMSAAPVLATAQEGQEETFRTPVAPVAPAAPAAPAARTLGSRRNQIVWALVAVLLVAGFAVYKVGKDDAVPGTAGTTPTNTQATGAPGAPAAVPVDQAKVAALSKKVTANPKDIASMQGLGDAYFAASDYKNAAVWEQRVLAVDPKNQVALLAAGAAQFNLGNVDAAKKQWLVAAGLYPNNAEVHYDLGYAYLSQKPADTAKMTAEWSKVVAIDPNSAMAKTVATHLKGAKTPAPGASAAPGAK